MASRLGIIAIDAVDPRPVADFWCGVLGWEITEIDDEGIAIAPPVGSPAAGGPTIDVLVVPERKTVKNRLHLDLRAEGVTPAEELQRLLALGATPVDIGQGPGVTWTVLADPDGNEFCLLGTGNS